MYNNDNTFMQINKVFLKNVPFKETKMIMIYDSIGKKGGDNVKTIQYYLKQLIDYNNGRLVTEQEAKQRAKEYVNRNNANKYYNILVNTQRNKKADGGSIHIAPSKRGTFTAAATKHGMGVQEFAARVLRNKENYSPAMVKKANFARNASKWH